MDTLILPRPGHYLVLRLNQGSRFCDYQNTFSQKPPPYFYSPNLGQDFYIDSLISHILFHIFDSHLTQIQWSPIRFVPPWGLESCNGIMLNLRWAVAASLVASLGLLVSWQTGHWIGGFMARAGEWGKERDEFWRHSRLWQLKYFWFSPIFGDDSHFD